MRTASSRIRRYKKHIEQLRIHKKKLSRTVERMRVQIAEESESWTRRLQSSKEKGETRLNQLTESLRVLSTESGRKCRELSDAISALLGEKEELEEKIAAAELEIRKCESKWREAVAEVQREKKLLECQWNAKCQSIEADYAKRWAEAAEAVRNTRKSVYDTILERFSNVLHVTQINEGNWENCLQAIKRRIDALMAREGKIRKLLFLAPQESIEDAINSKIWSRRRRCKSPCYRGC
jgi:chromosome segregation ATPase